MKRIQSLAISPIAAALMLVGNAAHAVPQLQLDILGGTYNSATETIMATSNSFSVFAYYKGTTAPTGNFYLSMALQPSASPGGNYGSFTVNSSTISATSGMTYGNPPLETIVGLQGHDAGDLPQHGIFPAYFAEQRFTFSSGNQSGIYNTQDSTGIGPQSGTGMFFARFDFNIAGLAQGLGLHFDLYDEVVQSCGKNKNCVAGDIDVNKFAPFSHDAGANVMPVSAIPEPETYAMLLAGLGILGFATRRRKQKEAATA